MSDPNDPRIFLLLIPVLVVLLTVWWPRSDHLWDKWGDPETVTGTAFDGATAASRPMPVLVQRRRCSMCGMVQFRRVREP